MKIYYILSLICQFYKSKPKKSINLFNNRINYIDKKKPNLFSTSLIGNANKHDQESPLTQDLCLKQVFAGYKNKKQHDPKNIDHQNIKTQALIKPPWYQKGNILGKYQQLQIDYQTAIMPKSYYYHEVEDRNPTFPNNIPSHIQNRYHEHEWLFLSLLPQMKLCGQHQNVDYPVVDCACSGESGGLYFPSQYTIDCLTDKMIFTANLMAIRIICDNINNPIMTTRAGNFKSTVIDDKLFHQIHETASRSVNWCKESALTFEDNHQSGLFWNTYNMQQSFLNVCLNWIQKCTEFEIKEFEIDNGRKPEIQSQCEIDSELFERISKKVFTIEKINKVKLVSSFGGLVGTGSFVILSILLQGNPALVATGVTFGIINYVTDKQIKHVKNRNEGNWVKLVPENLNDLVNILSGVITGYHQSFGCITKGLYEIMNNVETEGAIKTVFKGAQQFRLFFKEIYKIEHQKESISENNEVFLILLFDTIKNNINNLVKLKNNNAKWEWKLNSDTCMKTINFGVKKSTKSKIEIENELLNKKFVAQGQA